MLDLQMPFYKLEPLIFQHYLKNRDITVFCSGGYKANCKCSGKTGECSWVMHPSFSCEKGCPHEHLAELREIRSWEDERPNHQGHFQLKLKAQFKPPAGEVDGWRLLIKFGSVKS